GPDDTAGEVLGRLAISGAQQLVDDVASIAEGRAEARPQEGEPTYAHKLTIDDARLDWQRPAAEILARYRGVTPEPGAHAPRGGPRLATHGPAAGISAPDRGAPPAPGAHTPLEGADLKTQRARAAQGQAAIAPGRVVAEGREVLVGTATDPIVLERVQPVGK